MSKRVEQDRKPTLDVTVRQFVHAAAGDPRLTWWEANFINSMAEWVSPSGLGTHLLTTKQWTIINQITVKIEAPLVEDTLDDLGDTDAATEVGDALVEPEDIEIA